MRIYFKCGLEREMCKSDESYSYLLLVSGSFIVAAVYDSTLNFRNNESPTLLGILNGKKYHADLYVRYKEMFCSKYILLLA